MSPGSSQLLQNRVIEVRSYVVRRARTAMGVWLGGCLVFLFIAGWLLAGSQGFVQGSDTPAILDAIALALVAGGVFRLRTWLDGISEEELASTIERSAGIAPGLVEGTLELSRRIPSGASALLAGRAVSDVADDLGGWSDEKLAGRLAEQVESWLRSGLAFGMVLAVTLAGLTLAVPARTSSALSGLFSPLSLMRDPVPPPLVVQPGDIEVLRGSDVELDISAADRVRISVEWQAAGDIARSESIEVIEGHARYTFRTVSANIEYRVVDAAGNASPSYGIVPVDPLFVSDMVLSVAYPPHTGLLADEFRGDPPPLRLPSGSVLVFEGLASRALSSVQLVDSAGSEVVSFSVEGNEFEARWSPSVSGSFEWMFRDQMGGAAEIQPEALEVLVVPDAEPTIEIPIPGRDTVMPLNLRQPLLLEGGDDYGLRRIELVAYRVTSFGERMEPVSQGFDVGGQRAILARPLLDLRGWGLMPGDTVRYYARAVDSSPVSQVSTSQEYFLSMPDAADLRREAEDAFQEVAERLTELAAEAERQSTENREQALESVRQRGTEQGASEEEAFQEREELEAALTEQREMNAVVDSMRQEMESLEALMQESGQADPELRRQLEELQELLEQMTGDELRQRMEEMAEALERENTSAAADALEEMADEQEELRDRLEEAMERFRRAALEQDFRATTDEIEELARQEQALADAMKEGDNSDLRARQQEDLARQTEAIEENMASLEERLAEMGEQQASEGVREAVERSSEARESMNEAQQRAEQGEAQEAGEQAQRAADEMQRAAQEMQRAMAEMAREQMEKMQRAMIQTADDALSLARRQNQLNEEMRGVGQEELAQMRAQQATMLQGIENIAENLQLATEGAMGESREISAQMGLAMESLQNTIDAMEGRRGRTPSALAQAEQAIGDLNQLALMAIANAEQMGQQGQGQGGEEVSEQLEQLAQQQGDIMNQSTQLMPMELGEQAMQQQMEQMSEGQQSVASDLGDLADEPGADESLGDLQQLAQEAQAIAEEMVNQGRLTPEMIQRQERLFHRLLDAGRSLEREEYSEERESEQPEEFERAQVMPLTGEQMGVMRYEIPDGTRLQELNPAVRQLILEYFERLNRSRPGGES